MESTTSPSRLRRFFTSKWTIGLVIIVVVIGGIAKFMQKPPSYQFITVTRGPITQSVALTGNTTSAQTVDLSFGSSGIIAKTTTDLGKSVVAGQILAELNTSDLIAQFQQAEANVKAQQARLESLRGGSRPEDIASAQANVDAQQARLNQLLAGPRAEDIAASQAALDKSKQDLANIYATINDTSIDAYAKANDAIRTQLDDLFSNAETTNPKLTYASANGQAQSQAESDRLAMTNTLNTWQNQLGQTFASTSEQERFLQQEITYLASVRSFLNTVSKTLDNVPALSASTVSGYRTNVSVSLSEVNAATKALNTITQSIASQSLTVSQSEAQLALKKAGALPTEIAAQRALVDQAQAQLNLKRAGTLSSDLSAQQAVVDQAKASVASVVAKIQNGQIVAPISGTITKFDAKIGQLASPGASLVSIMSNAGYEVHSSVSETDVGKIVVGNPVSMTIDAFPGETFKGSVFYIAPSETNTQGVISYEVKISFEKPDARLKSGLTANIDLITETKESVLLLPQYAIIQNDDGIFVETVENEEVTKHPVTLGIQDQQGNVEILTGVTEGQQVLNIGRTSL